MKDIQKRIPVNLVLNQSALKGLERIRVNIKKTKNITITRNKLIEYAVDEFIQKEGESNEKN